MVLETIEDTLNKKFTVKIEIIQNTTESNNSDILKPFIVDFDDLSSTVKTISTTINEFCRTVVDKRIVENSIVVTSKEIIYNNTIRIALKSITKVNYIGSAINKLILDIEGKNKFEIEFKHSGNAYKAYEFISNIILIIKVDWSKVKEIKKDSDHMHNAGISSEPYKIKLLGKRMFDALLILSFSTLEKQEYYYNIINTIFKEHIKLF